MWCGYHGDEYELLCGYLGDEDKLLKGVDPLIDIIKRQNGCCNPVTDLHSKTNIAVVTTPHPKTGLTGY